MNINTLTKPWGNNLGRRLFESKQTFYRVEKVLFLMERKWEDLGSPGTFEEWCIPQRRYTFFFDYCEVVENKPEWTEELGNVFRSDTVWDFGHQAPKLRFATKYDVINDAIFSMAPANSNHPQYKGTISDFQSQNDGAVPAHVTVLVNKDKCSTKQLAEVLRWSKSSVNWRVIFV